MTDVQNSPANNDKVIADRGGKYLTFSLADEEYGIGILKIKEIIGMMPITEVPQTPQFVKGVINLRGQSDSRHRPAPSLRHEGDRV